MFGFNKSSVGKLEKKLKKDKVHNDITELREDVQEQKEEYENSLTELQELEKRVSQAKANAKGRISDYDNLIARLNNFIGSDKDAN